MAINRRSLNSSISLSLSNFFGSPRVHSFKGKGEAILLKKNKLFVVATIISCLVTNNCFSFARQVSAKQQQQWPQSQPNYQTLYSYSALTGSGQQLPAALGQQFDEPSFRSSSSSNSNSANDNHDTLNIFYAAPEVPASEQASFDGQLAQLNDEINSSKRKQSNDIYLPDTVSFKSSPLYSIDSAPLEHASSRYSTSAFDNPSLSKPVNVYQNRLLDLLNLEGESRQLENAREAPPLSADQFNFYNTYDLDALNQKLTNQLPIVASAQTQPATTSEGELSSASNDNGAELELAKFDEAQGVESAGGPEGPPRRFSTLLEEDEEAEKKSKTEASNRVASSPVAQTMETSTAASYATVLNDSSQASGLTTVAPSSLFEDMYRKLASYWPFYNQINLLRGTGAPVVSEINQEATNGKNSTEGTDKKTVASEHNQAQEVKGAPEGGKRRKIVVKTTKQSVSETSNDNKATESLIKNQSNGSISLNESIDISKSMLAQRQQQPDDGHKVNLLKKSSNSLVLPVKSSDELLLRPTSGAAEAQSTSGDSLLGKIVYAPARFLHFSLPAYDNEPLKRVNANKRLDSEADSMEDLVADASAYRQQQQEAEHRHLQNPYRSSYGLYRSSALHREPVGISLANKTNDLYFLVMVAAFCVMAMAVVLAAGLFAYRVQQNRKLNTECDYPTYGVVGPNNMNGKCDAAAFAGGYFASVNGGLVTGLAGNAKLGAALSGKHGHGGAEMLYGVSDSGLASGKSSASTRCGGSNSEHHHQAAMQHQACNKSNNSSMPANFMANQDAARMYHYQHQKQQMIINARASAGRHTSASDLDSEDENDDGSYTVYECPGLASAHEMEIKNPLFNDDQTP